MFVKVCLLWPVLIHKSYWHESHWHCVTRSFTHVILSGTHQRATTFKHFCIARSMYTSAQICTNTGSISKLHTFILNTHVHSPHKSVLHLHLRLFKETLCFYILMHFLQKIFTKPACISFSKNRDLNDLPLTRAWNKQFKLQMLLS